MVDEGAGGAGAGRLCDLGPFIFGGIGKASVKRLSASEGVGDGDIVASAAPTGAGGASLEDVALYEAVNVVGDVGFEYPYCRCC